MEITSSRTVIWSPSTSYQVWYRLQIVLFLNQIQNRFNLFPLENCSAATCPIQELQFLFLLFELPKTLIGCSCFRKFTFLLSARSWWCHVSTFHFWKTGFSTTSARISLAPLLNSTQELCIDWRNDECINGTIDGNCLHIDFVDMLWRIGCFELLWWLCASCAGGSSRAMAGISVSWLDHMRRNFWNFCCVQRILADDPHWSFLMKTRPFRRTGGLPPGHPVNNPYNSPLATQ